MFVDFKSHQTRHGLGYFWGAGSANEKGAYTVQNNIFIWEKKEFQPKSFNLKSKSFDFETFCVNCFRKVLYETRLHSIWNRKGFIPQKVSNFLKYFELWGRGRTGHLPENGRSSANLRLKIVDDSKIENHQQIKLFWKNTRLV